jgi:hypothetical protein
MRSRPIRLSARRAVAGLALSGLAGSTLLVAAGSPAGAAHTELPVYEVQESGLRPDQAELLRGALGLEQLDLADDGSVRFTDENTFGHVPTVETGKGEPDEDGNATTASALDLEALKELKPLDPDQALAQTGKALEAAGLLPAGARATAGHTTFEAVDANGESIASTPLDTTVTYSFTLGDLPYEGPGAKIRVSYDSQGAVTQLAYNTRTLGEAGTVPVLDPIDGRRRCAEALGGSIRVRAATYAYHAPKLSEALSRLEPSFRCSGVAADGTPAQVVFVPAAVDATLPPLPPPPPPREDAKTYVQQMFTQAYGLADVGSEGTGPCSGLPHTGTNLGSFNGQFSSRGIPVEFSWLDQNAWEDDFKDPVFNGHDSDWTDHVDMTYWQGHGSPTGFSFSGCSSIDDTFMANTEARWGNGDLEWMSLFTCLVLAEEDGGQRWWQRWGNAFHGLHQINSFHTVSYHSASHGGTYANYMLRTPFLWWNNPMPVRSAWAQASIDDQPSSVVWATMGPIGPGGLVNLNDYFWGKGAVGPDVPASQVSGYWYVSGSS